MNSKSSRQKNHFEIAEQVDKCGVKSTINQSKHGVRVNATLYSEFQRNIHTAGVVGGKYVTGTGLRVVGWGGIYLGYEKVDFFL